VSGADVNVALSSPDGRQEQQDSGDSGDGVYLPVNSPLLGSALPSGWSYSVMGQVLGIYDSNPLQQPTAAPSDIAASYSGMIEVSKLSGHTLFEAAYIPDYTQYRRFDELANLQQKYHQTLSHSFNRRTELVWTLDAHHYPAWGGSSLASSNYGALIMSVTGTSDHDLLAAVTNTNTSFRLNHQTGKRAHIYITTDGSVSWFSDSAGTNPVASVLLQPSSKFWTGGASIGYHYDLTAHRSVGIDAGSLYDVDASQNFHVNYQKAHLTYREELRSGWSYEFMIGPGLREDQGTGSTAHLGLDFAGRLAKTTHRSVFLATLTRSYLAGQFAGSLTSWYGILGAQHFFGQHWIVGLNSSYIGAFYPPGTPQYNNSTTAVYNEFGRVGYRLNRKMAFTADYGYSTYQGSYNGYSRLGRSRVATGLVMNISDKHAD
jgi:hypothetical protein